MKGETETAILPLLLFLFFFLSPPGEEEQLHQRKKGERRKREIGFKLVFWHSFYGSLEGDLPFSSLPPLHPFFPMCRLIEVGTVESLILQIRLDDAVLTIYFFLTKESISVLHTSLKYAPVLKI